MKVRDGWRYESAKKCAWPAYYIFNADSESWSVERRNGNGWQVEVNGYDIGEPFKTLHAAQEAVEKASAILCGKG